MKQKCTFSISDIDAGWLDMDFKKEKKIVEFFLFFCYTYIVI